jgi:carboxylate-amine ligase
VREGVVPAEVVDTCLFREPGPVPAVVPVGIAGPDVVRAGDGDLVVLEDNLRTPTLMGYAQAWPARSAGP